MNVYSLAFALSASLVCLVGTGCDSAPGKPKLATEALRPEQVLDFPTLYKHNCSACHGDDGQQGAAISLANPVYLAVSGVDNLQHITASGIPGTLMPGFGHAAGGMLTDKQIVVLVQGMVATWGRPGVLTGSAVPSYASSSKGDPAHGQQAFATFCARCHGIDGSGMNANKEGQIGSLVDPAYLALVSDQGVRSLVIAGMPEQHMPDWRSDLTGAGARAMTAQEITDVVAWLGAHRIEAPGQPYQQHP